MTGPVRQRALTLLATVRPGRGPELEELLEASRRAVQAALGAVTTLHFGRFVVLPPFRRAGEAGPGAEHRLCFESNFDGDLDPHLAELWEHAGEHLERFFSWCEGWSSPASLREFVSFAREHTLRSQAFYSAHPGLSATRVRRDQRLREAADAYLDEQRAQLSGQPRRAVVDGLRAHLSSLAAAGAGFDLEHVERGLPDKTGGFWSAAAPYWVRLVAAVLGALPRELRDWAAARRSPPALETPEIRRRRDRIGLHEDRLQQNGLTHLVPIKPGRFRRRTLELMLLLAQELGERGARTGRLGELETIHFARWTILPDGRLLFFSNYDGSWEAYLSDFIDKASAGLTMIWSNTLDFPTTWGLFFAGSRDEERFKRWTRAHQYPTQIWYSAYPTLSVTDVLANHELRELLAGEPSEATAARVCEIV